VSLTPPDAAIFKFAGDADAAFGGVDADLIATREGRVRGPDAPASAGTAGFEASLGVLTVAVRDEGALLRIVHAHGQVTNARVFWGVFRARDEFEVEAEGAGAEGFAPVGDRGGSVGDDRDAGRFRLGPEDRGGFGQAEADHLRLAGFELRAQLAEQGGRAFLPRVFFQSDAAGLVERDPAGARGQHGDAVGVLAEQAGGETDGGGGLVGHFRGQKNPGA